jgi:hypothetical protein
VTPMSLLMSDAPEAAKAHVLRALKAANGDLPTAAKALRCSWRTLYRWTADLGLRDELDEIRSRNKCPKCGQPLHHKVPK